jgi:hypothetical protein
MNPEGRNDTKPPFGVAVNLQSLACRSSVFDGVDNWA